MDTKTPGIPEEFQNSRNAQDGLKSLTVRIPNRLTAEYVDHALAAAHIPNRIGELNYNKYGRRANTRFHPVAEPFIDNFILYTFSRASSTFPARVTSLSETQTRRYEKSLRKTASRNATFQLTLKLFVWK